MQKLITYHSGEDKLRSYYDAYDKEFVGIRRKDIKLLEIGVQSGNSLKLWSKYFPNAEISGVDIDESCAGLAIKGMKVFIGDQLDKLFMSKFAGYDVVIDDGGHTMKQQQETFKYLFPLLKSGGVYVIEDIHTSFWTQFQDIPTKTTDYFKNLTDSLHIHANIRERMSTPNYLLNELGIASIHFYPSIIFIWKN